MKKVGVYILKGDRYYCGSTDDLERRLRQHKNGQTRTTRSIGDWKLLRFISCASIQEARKLELKIKASGHYSRWCQIVE
jgi:predicted GIY-YIG superfamily endonuclease